MNKKGILVILLLFIMSFITVGCEINDIKINELVRSKNDLENEIIEYEIAYGGELVVPISYIKTFNPLTNKDKSIYYFNKLIYEGLFEFDSDLNIRNVLAENYMIYNNGQTIKIELRDDVLWHDGKKFTAFDVEFTIDEVRKKSNDSIYGDIELLKNIKSIDIIDDYTFEINFDKSYSNILENLTLPIVPKHQFEKSNNITKPIGTGPYKFAEYSKLKYVKLESNSDWWKGKPYISEIIGKILSDSKLAMTSFEIGEIDLASNIDIDWEKYAQDSNIKIYEFPTQQYEFIGFNFNNELFIGESGKAIRKAIFYGINRQLIVDRVYLGHGILTDSPIPPYSWIASDGDEIYEYNVIKAKKILEDAGWIDIDGDGIRENVAEKDLEIRLLTNSYNNLRKETAEIIMENLSNIGIKVIPMFDTNKIEATQEMIDNQWEEVQSNISLNKFDMVLLGWKLSNVPDLSFAFHSSQIENGTNFIAYNNKTIDNKLDEALLVSDRAEKKKIYAELESLLLEEVPYVSLFFKNSSVLINKKVYGDINPQAFNIYYDIEKWFIPEPLQDKKKVKTEEEKMITIK